MDESWQHQFIRIIAEEMLRRRPQVESDLRDVLERLGWTLYEGHMVELAILDISDLPELPADSRGDLVKAATRLRDGDLSGAISSACAAVDTVTSRIYQEEGLGDPGDASFQDADEPGAKGTRYLRRSRATNSRIGLGIRRRPTFYAESSESSQSRGLRHADSAVPYG
jgi:hypothetical protein